MYQKNSKSLRFSEAINLGSRLSISGILANKLAKECKKLAHISRHFLKNSFLGKFKLANFASIISLLLIFATFGQFLNISVKAAAPGPFWTWNGSGVPTKIPNSENYEKIYVGNEYYYGDPNYEFYFAKQGTDILSWGKNQYGQLGDGTAIDSTTPTINPNLAGLIKISPGSIKSLGLKSDGTVIFWGHRGNGYVATPEVVPGLSNIVDIDMQFNGGLALDLSGNVYEIPWPGDSSSLVSGLNNITAIAQGYDSRYALDSSGKVWAWGRNPGGALGDGTTADNYTPTIVKNLPKIKSISAGMEHVLALDTDGDVWAWGRSLENQIGQGEASPQTTALKVQGLPPIKEVYASGNASKVVDFSQKVWEWGGYRTGGQSNIPTTLSNPVDNTKPMLADSNTLTTNGFTTFAKRDLIVQSSIDIGNTANQSSISPNSNLQYTYQYINKSNLTANNLVLTTTLDPSLTFNNCSDSCQQNNQIITWNVGDVAPAGTQSLTLDVSLSISTPIGKLSNTIESTGSNFDPTSATSVIDVVKGLNFPDLTLNITSSSDPVSQGDNFTYFLNYSNTLPQDANNVVIADTLDPRLTVTSLPGNCTQVDQVVTCTIGTVGSGNTGSVDIPVQVANDAAGGSLANTGIISSDQSLPRSSGNHINVNMLTIDPGVTITKTTTGNTYSVVSGDTVPYMITLQNKSLITDYNNVSVTDVLDQRLDYNNNCDNSCTVESFTPSSNAFTINTLEWSGLTIPANSSISLTYSATVKNSAASGELWNTAIMNYSQCSPVCVDGNKSSSFPVTVLELGQNTPNGDIDYTITKTASNLTPRPGDIIDYTIRIASTGVIGTMQFTDVLDSRLTFVSCDVWPGCNVNGQTITFSAFVTPVYGDIVIHVIVKVNDNAAPGTLNNTILADDGNPNKDPQAKSATSTVQIQPLSNSPLQISKVASKSLVSPGDTYDYIINYTNIGTSNLDGVTITDTLDPRLTFNSCSGGCSQNGQTITWVAGTLNFGDTNSFSINVTVNNPVTAGLLANSAAVSANQTNPVSGITYVRVVVPEPTTSLSLTKTASVNAVSPGGQITYTLDYTNTSNVGLTGGVITDTLDSSLDFVSCSSSCTHTGQNISWDIGSLGAGDGSSVTVVVNVKSNAALGIVTNTGNFKTNETSAVTSSVDVDIQSTPTTSITLVKSANVTSVTPGGQITYSLDYENTSNVGVTGGIITDSLDPRLDFVSCSNSCNQTGQNISWNIGDLNPNDTGTVTLIANVKSNATLGTIINTGFFDTNETNSVSSSVNVTIQPIVPMTLSKSASATNVDRGETYTYTVNYTNSNIIGVTNTVITDTLDSRLDFLSCSNSCTQSGQNLTWNIGNIVASGTGNVTVTVKVKSLAVSGLLANTAQISSTETASSTATAFVSVNRIYQTATPTLTKTQNKTELLRGDALVYTINYSNTSDVNFSNAVITDVLNSNLSFVSCNNSCTQSGQTLTWNIGSLPIGATGSITINVNVKSNATLGLLQNTASISTTESPTVQAFSFGAIIINDPILTPALSISKSASVATAGRGDSYTYTLNYSNGLTPVTGASITDTLDSRLTFVSCSNSCTQSGQNLTWNLGNLAANATGSVTVIVSVKSNAAVGGLDNIAILDSTETVPVNSNKVTVGITIPDNPTLTISKTVSSNTVAPNGNLTYTINYSNTANQPVTNTVITDVLDSNLSYVSCSNSCTQSGQTITWNIGSLAPNASGSVTLNVNVSNSALNGLINNTATIDSNETTLSSSDVAVAVIIPDTARINILKSSSTATANRAQTYSYTITYQNGSVPVTGASITDTLDSRLTFQTSAGCTAVAQTVTCNLGNLAAGASGTKTINVLVKDNAAVGGLDNTASVSSNETTTTNSNKVTVAIVTPDNPSMKITKTANKTIVAPGDNVIYTLNYTNTANQPATGVVITDVLDTNFTLVSACTGTCNYNLGTKTLTYNIGSLADNASGTITIEVQVNSSTTNTLINNTATIDSNETTLSSSDVAVAVIAIIPANISIVKSASTSTLHRGDTFTYTISYANSSIPVTNTSISDVLNSNLSFVSCTGSCSQSGSNITWNIGNLTPNQSGSVSVTVQVKTSSVLGSIDNLATITSVETTPKTASTKVSVIIDDPTPILNLNVITDKSNVNPGQNINYTVNYSNPSTTNVTNTQIQTTLDPGVSLMTPCNTQCTQVGQVITWNIGNLNAGANGSLSFEVQVQNNASFGLLTNTLNITSTQSIPSNFSSSVAIIPVNVPITASLSISKSTNQFTVFRGNNVNYTISYLNGLTSVTNATITDTLDSRLTFVSCSNLCTQSGQTITWNLGNLTPNQTGTVTLNVQIKNNAALGNLDNTASIISNQTTSNSATSTIALIINDPTPSLSINKVASAQTLEPGTNLTYTISYSNPSLLTASNATITDSLDSRLSFVSCTNSCTQSGQDISWNLGNLTANSSGVVSITVLVSSAISNSLISNTAQIQAPSFNTASSTTSVAIARVLQQKGGTTIVLPQNVNGSNLNILATADKKLAQPGENVSFTIKYSNDGPTTIQNVDITYSVSKYLNINSCSNNCSISGQTVVWKLGSISSNQTGTVTLLSTVKEFPSVLGVNSNSTNQNPTNPVSKVDLSESKAVIKGDGTIAESSTSSIAVFDIVAGTALETVKNEKTTEEILIKPILVRTGTAVARDSQLIYIILEISLFGFVYLSLMDRKVKKD